MELYYRNRDSDEKALPIAIKACQQQIEISEQVKKAFKKD
jgi:hypothetical protein